MPKSLYKQCSLLYVWDFLVNALYNRKLDKNAINIIAIKVLFPITNVANNEKPIDKMIAIANLFFSYLSTILMNKTINLLSEYSKFPAEVADKLTPVHISGSALAPITEDVNPYKRKYVVIFRDHV